MFVNSRTSFDITHKDGGQLLICSELVGGAFHCCVPVFTLIAFMFPLAATRQEITQLPSITFHHTAVHACVHACMCVCCNRNLCCLSCQQEVPQASDWNPISQAPLSVLSACTHASQPPSNSSSAFYFSSSASSSCNENERAKFHFPSAASRLFSSQHLSSYPETNKSLVSTFALR